MADARTTFRHRFGFTPPTVVSCPLPVELLGVSALMSESASILAGVDPGITVAMAARPDGKIQLVDPAGTFEQFFASQIPPSPHASPLAVIKAVLTELRGARVHFGGLSAALDRAKYAPNEYCALAAATVLAVRNLYPFQPGTGHASRPPARDSEGRVTPATVAEKKELAHLCRRALQRLRLDLGPAALFNCFISKAGFANSVESPSLALEYLPWGDLALLLASPAETAAIADLTPLIATSAAAAAAIQMPSLRRLERAYLRAWQGRLPADELACANYIMAETQRVIFAERALRENDEEQFLQYMRLSQEDWAQLALPPPEMQLLAELGRTEPDCLAMRQLAGQETMLYLVRHRAAPKLIVSLSRRYKERTGREVFISQGRPGGGSI